MSKNILEKILRADGQFPKVSWEKILRADGQFPKYPGKEFKGGRTISENILEKILGADVREIDWDL